MKSSVKKIFKEDENGELEFIAVAHKDSDEYAIVYRNLGDNRVYVRDLDENDDNPQLSTGDRFNMHYLWTFQFTATKKAFWDSSQISVTWVHDNLLL
jgi:hypothetical protein